MQVPIPLEELELTPHKKRILQLRFEGHSQQSIADKFGLSVKTIEAHLYQIYGLYEVHNLLEFAWKVGWLSVPLKRSDLPENKPQIGLTPAHVL